MNFLQLCQAVRSECGEAGIGPTDVVSQTGVLGDIVRWVNQEYLALQGNGLVWKWLRKELTLTLSIGVRNYTPGVAPWNTPAEAAEIRAFDDRFCWLLNGTVRHPVRVFDTATFDRRFPTNTNTGIPAALCVREDGTVRLNVAPDQAYTIEAKILRAPQTLAASTDVPRMKAEYHDVLVMMATIRYATKRGDDTLLARTRDALRPRYTQLALTETEPIEFR